VVELRFIRRLIMRSARCDGRFPARREEFQNTYDLVADLPLTHLHVFSYSPRPGTPAASLPHQVPDKIKK